MNETWERVKRQLMTFVEIMSVMAGYLLTAVYNLFAKIFGKERRSTTFKLRYSPAEVPIDSLHLYDIFLAVQSLLCAVCLSVVNALRSALLALYNAAVSVKDFLLSIFSFRKKGRSRRTAKAGGVVVNVVVNVIVTSGIIILGVLGSILYAVASILSAVFRR